MATSRIKLIGGVDLTTPIDVIDELCKFYHIDIKTESLKNLIYRSKVITTLLIQDSKITRLSPPYNLNDMRNIATYLNYKDIEWKAEDILTSYQFLNKIERCLGLGMNEIGTFISNREYGEIKPKSETLDYLTIYGISKRLNIRLKNIEYDPRTVLNHIRGYINTDKEEIEIKIISNIHSFGLSSLYRLISSSGVDSKVSDHYTPNAKYITEFHSQIIKEETIGEHLPKNRDEAVVMTVLNYNLDISSAGDPLITYHQIVKNPRYRVYFPSITRKFNPSLPRCLYGNALLKKLAIDEGYSRKRINNEDPLMLCQQSMILNNFVHGRVKRYSNKVTPIYRTLIGELEYHRCVSYGCGSDSGDFWVVYTYRELFDTFEYNREFNIPDKKSDDIFTNQNIRKLLLLTSVNKYIGENNSSDRKDLNRKIKQIISSRKKLSIETQALIEYCKNNNNLTKISYAFSILTKATMYMRGWNGNEEYPLVKAITPSDKEQEIFYQVITNLSLYEKYISSNTIELLMNTLPLVQYNEGNFLKNRDVDKGLTIGNRIDIIKDKNSDKNQYSCIRTTSNWFLASIYRYRTILRLDHDFDIDKARKIY